MRASLLTILLLMTVGCEDDNGPTSPSAPSLSFFVTSATSVTGNLGGLAGADATCQRLATAVGERQHIMARLPERRTGSREQQSADPRARPHRHRAVVQRRPAARRQQRRRASFAHGGCRALRGRARAADQRPVDRVAQPGRTRHPDRLELGRDRAGRHDLRGLDVRFGERRRRRSDIRTGWVRARARRPLSRPGTLRTPTRTARTRRLAAEQAGSTVSRPDERRATCYVLGARC